MDDFVQMPLPERSISTEHFSSDARFAGTHNDRSQTAGVDTAEEALTVQHYEKRIRHLGEELRKKDKMLEKSNDGLQHVKDICKEFVDKLQHSIILSDGDVRQSQDEAGYKTNPRKDHSDIKSRDISYQEEIKELKQKNKEKDEVNIECTLKYKRDVEQLHSTVDKLKAELTEYQATNETLTAELFRCKGETEKNSQKAQMEILPQLEHYKHVAEQQGQELDSLLSERSHLMDKLSKEWSNKVSANESDMENITIKTRPMNVASQYDGLYSGEWLDIKTDLDNVSSLDEENKIRTLCTILLKAEEIATSKFKEVVASVTTSLTLRLRKVYPSPTVMTADVQTQTDGTSSTDMDMEVDEPESHTTQVCASTKVSTNGTTSPVVADLLTGPASVHTSTGYKTAQTENNSQISSQPDEANISQSQKPPCGDELDDQGSVRGLVVPKHLEVILHNTLGDILRVNADDVDLTSLEMHISKLAREEFAKHEQQISPETVSMGRYVRACCRLCWKMAIQRPPMTFSMKGLNARWDHRTQEPFFECKDPLHKDAVVNFFVKPGLVHADKLMVKAQVMTEIHPAEHYTDTNTIGQQ